LTVTGEQNKHRLAHPSQGFFTDRKQTGPIQNLNLNSKK